MKTDAEGAGAELACQSAPRDRDIAPACRHSGGRHTAVSELMMLTEAMTETFYDTEDVKYRDFWDPQGSLHWGVFESQEESFLQGCERWNNQMLELSRIDRESRVLDLGCGNGTTAAWLAHRSGARVVGIDLSRVRIENAQKRAAASPSDRLSFQRASATDLPFRDGEFSHVFSQAVLYHVHDRERALAEIARVLEPGGILAFDDLVTPSLPVGPLARQHIYERLLFQPTFSCEQYVEALERAGFMVYLARDLSPHLARSYELLAELAEPKHPRLTEVYRQIPGIVESADVGWCFFLAQKVVDKLTWIYGAGDPRFTLREKYDAWSRTYDRDLGEAYEANPRTAAGMLARHVPTTARVLDAGAGTGLVGVELKKHGFDDLTALDQSAGVLAQAEAKGVYSDVIQGEIRDAVPRLTGEPFDAIVAVGVFTFGHAGPAELPPLCEALRPGGYLLLAVRADYDHAEPELRGTLARLGLEEVDRADYFIFGTEAMRAILTRKPG